MYKDIPIEVHTLLERNRRNKKLIVLMVILMVVSISIATMMGEARISIENIVQVVFGKLFHQPQWLSSIPKGILSIIWEIRLPRIISGVFVGGGLAISGAVFQGLLMNPLADPYTIGISTGAALGAVIAIYVSAILQIVAIAILPAAFGGALLTLIIVMKIADQQGLSSGSLIIAGIIVSSIGSAAISFIKSMAGDEVSLIVFWLMGSLASRTWQHVLVIVPITLIGGYVCYHYGRELNIICTGDEHAQTYGVDVKKVRRRLLICASLMTAGCVSVSGIIGFVGLVIPHMLRHAISADYKYLIPLSGLFGGMMLLIADNLIRSVFVMEIPVGVLTTLIGGPFFIYLFTRKKRKGGSIGV